MGAVCVPRVWVRHGLGVVFEMPAVQRVPEGGGGPMSKQHNRTPKPLQE